MIASSLISKEYLSFLIFIIAAFGLCFLMLALSSVLGGKSLSRYKNTPFESGIVASTDDNLYFSVKFYLIAMFFVIFDVESLYLYAWSVSVHESGWVGFFGSLSFAMSLLLALFYLIRIKALKWTSS